MGGGSGEQEHKKGKKDLSCLKISSNEFYLFRLAAKQPKRLRSISEGPITQIEINEDIMQMGFRQDQKLPPFVERVH
ncbi:hypothetical protein JTE90_006466 [Oedothorax gibbosus]|uniref:Uncharacterized protein n=1 Tax=Oedothorax gibbosus TaxID=931172 RepID=A0AAV6UIW9_9ARAC|nr:hypothetical protein JTE90_006466 [Oedothorax gibbosus]